MKLSFGAVFSAAAVATIAEGAATPAEFPQLMLTAVNAERAKLNLAALCLNSKLLKAAQLHSEDQATNNFMSHTGTGGSTMQSRISAASFNWNLIAENVAAGQVDVTTAMSSWMNSPGHKANILGNYTFFGVGYAYNAVAAYRHYWTQDFAAGSSESCDVSAPTVTTNATTPAPATTTPSPVPTTKVPPLAPVVQAPTATTIPARAITPAPITKSPSPAPSSKVPTPAPTTKTPTPVPTTKTLTPAPTTKAPTPAPTMKTPTAASTTKMPTPAPTTKVPTPTLTAKAPTPGPTTKIPTPVQATKAPTAAQTSVKQATAATLEQAMLTAVNAERAMAGKAPLCTNAKLQKAAQLHAEDQAANNFMGHTGSSGSTMQSRIDAQAFDWNSLGENVAAGQAEVTTVMAAWIASPGHKANILGNFTFFGMGYALNAKATYVHYWTQDFARGMGELCEV